MIDVREMLYDPDFCEEFNIIRKTGDWVNHRWVDTPETITVTGIATPINSKDMDMLPEGDRISGLKTFYADQVLRGSNDEATADICEYNGDQYRIFQVFEYNKYGFYKGIGKLIGGA